jgi:hypothetical protein
MKKNHREVAKPDAETLRQDKTGPQEQKKNSGDAECRCKEAKGKTVSQLLRQIMDDLTFWKTSK